MGYVIRKLEPRLYRVNGVESGLSGLDEVAGMVRRVRLMEQGGYECTMVDYADFNYQHPLWAQSTLFRRLAVRFERLLVHPDVMKAANWCADALLNQWCIFPGESEPVRITQGMFSGCRGTNFINTLLLL